MCVRLPLPESAQYSYTIEAAVYKLASYSKLKYMQKFNSSSELCLQPVEAGPCRGYFPRWFYNTTSERCEQFIYGGCKGNVNRFETRENCESACECGKF